MSDDIRPLKINVVPAPDKSPCCGAPVTVFMDDGSLYCKKCYDSVAHPTEPTSNN